jgi:hypothetical protein
MESVRGSEPSYETDRRRLAATNTKPIAIAIPAATSRPGFDPVRASAVVAALDDAATDEEVVGPPLVVVGPVVVVVVVISVTTSKVVVAPHRATPDCWLESS